MGVYEAALVSKETKTSAIAEPFIAAPRIVQRAIQKHVDLRRPVDALKPIEHLARKANYARSSSRPKERVGLDFELKIGDIPDNFLISDVTLEGARHLVFATEQQLAVLKDAKVWYIDATFKVVREPFYQLFSVHSFVRTGEDMKQIPLLFALMSRRRTKGYLSIIQCITEKLEKKQCATNCS